MPAWDSRTGEATVRSAGDDMSSVFGPDAHVIFASQWRPVAKPGAAATNGRDTFMARWNALTAGVLDGWPFWANTIVVGGAVVACLCPSQRTDVDSDDDKCAVDATAVTDIDLIFYGVTDEGAARLRAQLVEHAYQFAAERAVGVAVLFTSRTMTIVFDSSTVPRLQVAFGRWSSRVDALQTADVDCCCAGFDGTTALLTARAALAWCTRSNVAFAARHEVRGSPTYEMRLWKYAQRHGFAVIDPRHSVSNTELVALRAQFAQAATARSDAPSSGRRGRRAGNIRQRRDIATTAAGLEWLLLADEGVFAPTPPMDALKVTSTCGLSRILANVQRAGFVESDNYGTHEEGYIVMEDDGPPADDACNAFVPHAHDTRCRGDESSDSDEDAVAQPTHGTRWIDSETRIRRSTLVSQVVGVDVDHDCLKTARRASYSYGTGHPDPWVLPRGI
mmetsp:Transcript_4955/g.15657  ORF Transcript_4955/g.15657 Transcript_4955/m.15657 type:complete len:448 (-) Transcript_4955:133-1476(-)